MIFSYSIIALYSVHERRSETDRTRVRARVRQHPANLCNQSSNLFYHVWSWDQIRRSSNVTVFLFIVFAPVHFKLLLCLISLWVIWELICYSWRKKNTKAYIQLFRGREGKFTSYLDSNFIFVLLHLLLHVRVLAITIRFTTYSIARFILFMQILDSQCLPWGLFHISCICIHIHVSHTSIRRVHVYIVCIPSIQH
jgi:hypothetical protein